MSMETVDGRTAAFEEAMLPVREALSQADEGTPSVEIRGSALGTPEESWLLSAHLSRGGDEDFASGHGPTFTEAAAAFVKDLGRFTPDNVET